MKRNYDFSKGAIIKGPIKSKPQVDNALKDKKLEKAVLKKKVQIEKD